MFFRALTRIATLTALIAFQAGLSSTLLFFVLILILKVGRFPIPDQSLILISRFCTAGFGLIGAFGHSQSPQKGSPPLATIIVPNAQFVSQHQQ
jgi:hypothetical protein